MRTEILKTPGLGASLAILLSATSLSAATLTLNFDTPGGTVLDINGIGTGLTARLAGTGAGLNPHDYDLYLSTGNDDLELSSQQADFNGQVNMDITSAPGINLSSLGFTGTQDFSVTAVFKGPILYNDFIDQLGVYVGKDSATLTRAGFIKFADPEYFSVNTAAGSDVNSHNYGFGLDVNSGLAVTISRTGNFWDYVINGVHWLPNTAGDGSGSYAPPSFLDTQPDLTVGIFAITPFNSNFKVYSLDSFSVTVVPEPSCVYLLGVGELAIAWRLRRGQSRRY